MWIIRAAFKYKEFTADEGQSTEEKVWDIGSDRTVREPRGVRTLHRGRSQRRASARKSYHQMHIRASLVTQMVKKNLPANAGDLGLIPGSGRSPGEGNGNPLQYSCLENSIDRGAWRATVCGVEWLSLSDPHSGSIFWLSGSWIKKTRENREKEADFWSHQGRWGYQPYQHG